MKRVLEKICNRVIARLTAVNIVMSAQVGTMVQVGNMDESLLESFSNEIQNIFRSINPDLTFMSYMDFTNSMPCAPCSLLSPFTFSDREGGILYTNDTVSKACELTISLMFKKGYFPEFSGFRKQMQLERTLYRIYVDVENPQGGEEFPLYDSLQDNLLFVTKALNRISRSQKNAVTPRVHNEENISEAITRTSALIDVTESAVILLMMSAIRSKTGEMKDFAYIYWSLSDFYMAENVDAFTSQVYRFLHRYFSSWSRPFSI